MDTINKKAIQDLLAVLNFIFIPNNFPIHEHLQHAFNGEGVHFQVFYQPERNEWTIGVLMRNTEYRDEYNLSNTPSDTPPALLITSDGFLTFTSQTPYSFSQSPYPDPKTHFWQFHVERINADEIIEDVVARMHKYDFNTHSVVELFEHTLNRHLHRCFDPKIKAMRQRNHETIATLVAQANAEIEYVKTRLLAFLSEQEHDHWGFDPEKHSNLGKALISYLQYNPMDLPVLSRRSKENPLGMNGLSTLNMQDMATLHSPLSSEASPATKRTAANIPSPSRSVSQTGTSILRRSTYPTNDTPSLTTTQ